MNFDEALFKHLTTYAGLANLTAERWFPDTVKQNTAHPHACYSLVSGLYDETLQGISNHAIHTYQFSIFGKTRISVNEVAKQLLDSFRTFPGRIGGIDGIDLQAVSLKSNTNSYEEATLEYRKDMDFEFQFNE